MRPLARRGARVVALGLAVVLSPAAAPGEPSRGSATGASERVHEVRPGDTLSAIARRHGVSVQALVAANQLPGAGVTLRIGQRLTIPPAAPRGPAVKLAAAPAPAGGAPRPPRNLMLAVPEFGELAPPFVWPVDGPLTSTFGLRRQAWHRGIDIKAERGAPVLAAAAGVVIASGVETRYGRVVKIAHDHGFVTVYAHNDRNRVTVGDRVAAGDPIATVGNSGRATTPHLHFEVRCDGRAYNPLYLLPLPPRIAQVDETDENPPDDD